MAFVFALGFAAVLAAQSSIVDDALPADLAAKIAGRVAAPDAVALAVVDSDDAGRSDDIRNALITALRTRGVRIAAGTDAATRIDVTCGSNLRERVCIADIRKATASETVAASRPYSRGAGETSAAPSLSLDVRPVFAQDDPILDIATAGDRLFVLQPDAVVAYRRADAGWQQAVSRPIAHARVWPRDVRGRLWVAADTLEVRLPGTTCRGAADLSTLACADENQPWPLAIENEGVDATRNYFTTREGLPFFAAAAVDTGANPRWVVADLSGSLALLDRTRQTVATLGAADDVVLLTAPCAAAPHVLTSSASTRQRGSDSLRLLRVAGTHVAAASSPLEFAGVVTALWSDPSGAVATAVVREVTGGRYEALHIAIACDR